MRASALAGEAGMNEAAVRSALAGRYTLVRQIGEGGAAVVYLARDLRHERDVALKVLKSDLAATLGHDRFLAEIAIAARLSHPNIVPLFDSGEADGHLYYVMPFVAGESLRTVLRRAGALAPPAALAIAREVADALTHAHGRGILHRDIKPENILIAEGHALVVDFGIAKAVTAAAGAARTRTGFALGTPGYMSPEQAAGLKRIDERTDVYGLACVVYEMLVGEPPEMWLADGAARLGRFVEASPAHRAALDRLPGRLEAALARALALRAEARFATVAGFAAALADASAAGPARYTADDIRDIVGRAAQIQAERPTPDGLFTVGGVERLAAEVGIPAEDVRRAMAELHLEPAAAVPAVLPVPSQPMRLATSLPAVTVERIVGSRIAPAQLAALEAELASAVGPGTATLWEGQLTWRTESTGGAAPRHVEVVVTPGSTQTRVEIAEWGEPFAPKVVGSLLGVVTGLPFGLILGMFTIPRLTPIFALAGLITGLNVFVRAAIQTSRLQREARLRAAADRIAGSIAAAAGRPPLASAGGSALP